MTIQDRGHISEGATAKAGVQANFDLIDSNFRELTKKLNLLVADLDNFEEAIFGPGGTAELPAPFRVLSLYTIGDIANDSPEDVYISGDCTITGFMVTGSGILDRSGDDQAQDEFTLSVNSVPVLTITIDQGWVECEIPLEAGDWLVPYVSSLVATDAGASPPIVASTGPAICYLDMDTALGI